MVGLGVLVVFAVIVVLVVLGMAVAFAIVVLGVFAVVVVFVVLVLECDRLDAVGRHHADAAEVRSVDQAVQPALELQPVDHQDLRFADGSRIGRGRPVDMRIPVGADERREGDMLSADPLHHVAEDREGGDHRDRFAGLRGRRRGGRQGERQGEDGGGGCQERSAGGHRNSFQASR